MAYNALNNLIDAYIYANGVQAITGQILNGVLKQMVSQLGSGYHLMGVAGPETTPEQNDFAMAYFAATAGEYTDFGGITLTAGEVAVLLTSGNGSWEKQTIYNVPTGTADLENTADFITNAVTDLVNYYTKTEVDDTLANYPTLEALATALADYYTKTEIDTILAGYTTNTALASALADYYNKNDIDGLLSVVNAALADRYTKSETDTKLADYYRKTETYDKDEVDSIVSALSRQEYIVAWDGLAAPDITAIPAGVTVTYSGNPYTGTLAASEDTLNKIYMVWNGVAYDMYATTQDGGFSWVPMGTTTVDLSQYATKDDLTQLDSKFGVYENIPGYIRAVTDNYGRLLYGVDEGGGFIFGKGTPEQVLNSILDIADTRVEKVPGKSLIDEDFASCQGTIENDEYLSIVTDSEGKLLEELTNDGERKFFGPVSAPKIITGVLDSEKAIFASREFFTINFPGYIWLCVDSDEKILAYIKEDGTCFSAFLPESFVEKIKSEIEAARKTADNVIARNADKDAAVVQAFFHGRHNPKYENFAFVWGSDFHGSTKALRDMFEYAESRPQILLSINTGDSNSASPSDPDILGAASAGFLKPIINVIGNHDNGYGADATKMATAKAKYDRFVAPFLLNGGFTQPSDISDYPCYYYKDVERFKIRILVVDIYDVPKVSYNGGAVANQDSPCISEKQANFIADAFASLPEDYAIMIAMHTKDTPETIINEGKFTDPSVTIENIDTGFSMDAPVVTDIVNAFIGKSSLIKTYNYTGTAYDALSENGLATSYSISVNFSSRQSSEFICFFVGHQHKDIVAHNGSNLDIYVINGGYGARDQSFSDIARLSEGVTKDCFNLVSIDRDNKKVNLVRIGANVTMDFTKRDMISLNY